MVVEVVGDEGDHLPAQHAVLGHQNPDPSQERLGDRGVRAHHLERVLLPPVHRLRGALQPDQRHAVEPHLAETEGDDPPVGVRAGGFAFVRHRAEPERGAGMREVLAEGVDFGPVGPADPVPGAGQLSQQGLQSDIDVDHLMPREGLGHRLDLVQIDTQEVPDVFTDLGEFGRLGFGGPSHRFGEGAERPGEIGDLRIHAAQINRPLCLRLSIPPCPELMSKDRGRCPSTGSERGAQFGLPAGAVSGPWISISCRSWRIQRR